MSLGLKYGLGLYSPALAAAGPSLQDGAIAGGGSTRVYYSNGNASTVVSSDSTAGAQTCVSLTFTPNASKSYAIFYSYEAQVTFNTTTGTVRLLEAGVSTRSCATNKDETSGGAGWAAFGGFYIYTVGGSPSSTTWTIDALRGNNAFGAGNLNVRNSYIFALELVTADVFTVGSTASGVTSTSYADTVAVTVTPASAGAYLVLADCLVSGTAGQTAVVKITDGSTDSIEGGKYSYGGLASPTMTPWLATSLSSATTFTARHRAVSGGTWAFTTPTILALRLDAFPNAWAASLSPASSGGQTTYTDTLTIAGTVLAKDHLVLGAWGQTRASASSVTHDSRLYDGTTVFGESNRLIGPGSLPPVQNAVAVAQLETYSAGAVTWAIQRKRASGVDSTIKAGSVLAALQLAA